jgi:cell division protein FtsL
MPEDYRSSELIRYLLRELPEDQVEAIEQRYFTNEDSFDELRRVEAELIDSYAAGELESDQKKKFEQLYLSMPEGKSRIQFAEALRLKASKLPKPATSFSGFKKWTVVQTLAAVLALFAIAGAWMIWELVHLRSENQSAQKKIQQLQKQSDDLQKQSASKIQELTKELDSARMGEDVQPPEPIEGAKPQPRFLAVLMLPGVARGSSGMQTISLDGGINFVRFDLKLDRDPFPAYRVSLQTADGEELWNLGMLKAINTGSGKTVKFDLPISRLDQRDYVLLLQGRSGAKFENVSAYPFRVKKTSAF